MRFLAFLAILATFAAHGATVTTAKFGDLGMDDNVVTNVDLSPLMNGVAVSMSELRSDGAAAAKAATNYTDAAIGTNNPAFVAAVTNCPVFIAANDGTTLGEFGEYGTLGTLLAALAAAITWLKANKANAADLRYALVDKTPPVHTINNTVTLDDRAINNLELVYDYEVTGWEFKAPSAFAPEGALSWPTWNAANARWESTGNDGFVLVWTDPDSGGEDAEYLTYEDQGGYYADINFNKPMKDLVVGDVVTCHTTIYSTEVNYQATVVQSYDDGDGNWAIEIEDSMVTLPTGLLVALTPDFVTGAQNDTYSSGEGVYDVAYEAQQLYEEGTNISALEFPPCIGGKARDFLIQFVVDSSSTIPQFPDGSQTPASQRVIQYWCSGTTFPTPAKNATSMMYLTEIESNKFLVRTESIQQRIPS